MFGSGSWFQNEHLRNTIGHMFNADVFTDVII